MDTLIPKSKLIIRGPFNLLWKLQVRPLFQSKALQGNIVDLNLFENDK